MKKLKVMKNTVRMSWSFASNSCAWNNRPVVWNWRISNARRSLIISIQIWTWIVIVSEIAKSIIDALEIARLETVVAGAGWNGLGVVAGIERGSQRNCASLVLKSARRCWHCWQFWHSRRGTLVGRRSRRWTSFPDRVGGMERTADDRIQNVGLKIFFNKIY